MEIEEYESSSIMRGIGPNQGKKRPATVFGVPNRIENYEEDLKKGLQLANPKLPTLPTGLTIHSNRRMSLQLEKQLLEMSVASGMQPVTIGDQSAMISCWNSVHGKPDSEKSPDKESVSPKETERASVVQVDKRPLGRTDSDEIRQALKQRHVQSMERALRRNSATVTVASVPVSNQTKMGSRSMSMVFADNSQGNHQISRSMSVVTTNSNINAAVLKVISAHENNMKVEKKTLNRKHVDENTNVKADLSKVKEKVIDSQVAARQSSYPGAFKGPSAVDKRCSMPEDKHVRFTIGPTGEPKEEVQYLYCEILAFIRKSISNSIT